MTLHSSTSSEWSSIVTWIAREELSLSKLVLFRIRASSKTMDQDDLMTLKSMVKTLTYGKMSQRLVCDRLTMISDTFSFKSGEIDAILLESMDIFHQAITEFLNLFNKHLKSNKSNTLENDHEEPCPNVLLTQLLSTAWDLLESYDSIRFRYASLCACPETSKRISSVQPGWLVPLSSAITLCHQILIRHSASSSEAFSYIHKMRSFIQSTTLQLRQHSALSDREDRMGSGNKEMNNSRTKPSIFYK